MLRTIGLMSGTSLDGVDAAYLETDGETIARLGPRLTLPYDPKLRRALRALLDRAETLRDDDPELLDAVKRLTDRHAEAVEALGLEADLIGFHGQTILHRPPVAGRNITPFTWQVGDAVSLARRTGMTVAYDFRSADVAAGGEGASLVPAYHQALAAGLERPLAVLNIGGVANVTWIGGAFDPAEPAPAAGSILAFDTGPGNALLDDWVWKRTGAHWDADGRLALAGKPNDAAAAAILGNDYFGREPPKSLDRDHFDASPVSSLSPEDGAATLVAVTARSAALASRFFPQPAKRWLVCGGGRRNPAIMRALSAAIDAPVDPVEAVGWDGDALEAQAFAYLALRSLDGLPLSFPRTTGVPKPLTGGTLMRYEAA